MSRVVVVGGGAAGLTFARNLARSSRHDVVVVESGGRDRTRHALDDPRGTHADSMVIRTAARGVEWYPRGRGVGGGALINGRFARVRQSDNWFPVRVPAAWSWNEMEHHLQSIPTVEIDVTGASPWAATVAIAGSDAGWRAVPTRVFARQDPEGFAIRTDFHVASLVVEENCVRGVRSAAGVIEDADHVVLAAGALASPELMGSHVLSESSRHYGLKDHPAVCFEWRAAGERHHGVGVVLELDDIQILTLHEGERILLVGSVLRVDSQGYMEWRNGRLSYDFQMLEDQRDVERLDQCLSEMIQLAHSTIPHAGEVIHCGSESTPLKALEQLRREEREQWLGRNTAGNWHAACSVPMGERGVVNTNGKVSGYDNLWCCDASVLSDLPQSPTQLPVMIAASEVARRFVATTS